MAPSSRKEHESGGGVCVVCPEAGDVVRVPARGAAAEMLGGEFAECCGDAVFVVSAASCSGNYLRDFVLLVR